MINCIEQNLQTQNSVSNVSAAQSNRTESLVISPTQDPKLELDIQNYITSFTEDKLNKQDDILTTQQEIENQSELAPVTNREDSIEVVKDIIHQMLTKGMDSYILMQRYSIQPKSDFMKRKLINLQSEACESFGSENLNYLNLKKGYSKVEQEKQSLEARKKESVNNDDSIFNKENKFNQSVSTTSFLSDAKVHKSRIEIEKELLNSMKKDSLLNKKRERDNVSHDNPQEGFMNNAVRKVSGIQLEKERYIKEAQKLKEDQLKSKVGLFKSQVLKFDMTGEKEVVIEEENNNIKVSSVVAAVNNSSTIKNENSICEMCLVPLGKSNYKGFPKCSHFIHQVNKFLCRNAG
jgi:hypothetical protein